METQAKQYIRQFHSVHFADIIRVLALTIGIGFWPALQKVYTVHNTSWLTQCLHSTILDFYHMLQGTLFLSVYLVQLSICPSILLPHLTVTA